ncbi:MAG: TonB-dependent receptor, partial [Bacteroidota bacterium]
MQNFIRLFILIMLISNALAGQNTTPDKSPGTLKGRVLNSEQGAIDYASVSLLRATGELVAGTITDEQGRYELTDLPLGNYTLAVQFLGFASAQRAVTLHRNQKTLRLDDITLLADQQLLDEVVVTGEKSQYQFKMDRRVFNVGEDVLTEGSNALDVLDQVPQVAVEPSGAVTLRGSSQVQIMVNGRRSGLTLNNALEQIAGENIERIEVITNPSASFSADGAAGIINIVLKKNREYGLKAELRATAGAPADHMLLPSFTYKQERINLFGNYRWRYSDYNGRYTANQFSNAADDLRSLRKTEREDRHDDGQSFYVGGDYFLTDKTSFTLAYFRADTRDSDETSLRYDQTDSEGVASELLRNGTSLENRDYNQLEANFTHDFPRRGQRLTADFQYDFWNSLKNWELYTTGNVPDNVPTDLRTSNRSASDDYTLDVQYRHPQGENGRWETG